MATSLYQLPDYPAVVRSRSTLQWLRVDIRTMVCQDVFALYRVIELAVVDGYSKPMTLNLYDYETELRSNTLTVQAWVDSLDNRALVLKDAYPLLNISEANYLPLAYPVNSSFQLAKRNYHPTHVVATEDYDDVIVNYRGLTPQYLHEHALWSIGGFFMPTTYHEYGLRIYNAGDIIRRSGDLAAGCLNFEKIGKVTQVPITPVMVKKVDENYTYFDRVVIDVGKPLKNKTVGIVLCGYLHLMDDFVRVIGDDTVMLSLRNIRYVERYLASRKHLDLPALALDDVETNALVAKVHSQEAVLAYLTSPYSFMVLIDNPNMERIEQPIDRMAGLGKYILPDDLSLGLLVDQLGRNLEPWPKWEAGLWALDTEMSHLPNYSFNNLPWFNQPRINDALEGAEAQRRIQPRMWVYRARV